MIDFEYLKKADIEVVNSKLTAADKREISEFLKAHREKQAHGKKSASMSAVRKNAKSAR
jgi:hypothetical protein